MGEVDDENNIKEAAQADTGKYGGKGCSPAKYPSPIGAHELAVSTED